MPRRRPGNDGSNIVRKNEIGIIRPVENKNEAVLRMIDRYSFQGLKSEPPDTLKLVFQQQPAIDRYNHLPKVMNKENLPARFLVSDQVVDPDRLTGNRVEDL